MEGVTDGENEGDDCDEVRCSMCRLDGDQLV